MDLNKNIVDVNLTRGILLSAFHLYLSLLWLVTLYSIVHNELNYILGLSCRCIIAFSCNVFYFSSANLSVVQDCGPTDPLTVTIKIKYWYNMKKHEVFEKEIDFCLSWRHFLSEENTCVWLCLCLCTQWLWKVFRPPSLMLQSFKCIK